MQKKRQLFCVVAGAETEWLVLCSQIKVVTSSVDRRVNKEGFVVPGVGDFANRYFGT